MTINTTVHTETGHRRRVVAISLAITAVVAAATLLGRPLAAEDADTYAVLVPVRDAAWTFALAAGLSIGLTYLAAGIATCLLVTRRGARIATAGAVLTSIGGVGFSTGFFAYGVAGWLATADLPGGEAFFDYYQENSIRVFGPQIAGFLLSGIGLILLALALWRSGVVPRWLPIAIPAAWVVMILGGTGLIYDVLHAVFMMTLVALAWYLWRTSRHE